jgi:Protein of unknown function (DUF2829)
MSTSTKKKSAPVGPNYEVLFAELNEEYMKLNVENGDLKDTIWKLSNQTLPRATTGLGFQQALNYLQEGQKVRRHGWSGYIIIDGVISPRLVSKEDRNDCVRFSSSGRNYVNEYVADAVDLLATDWEVF